MNKRGKSYNLFGITHKIDQPFVSENRIRAGRRKDVSHLYDDGSLTWMHIMSKKQMTNFEIFVSGLEIQKSNLLNLKVSITL